MSYFTSVLGLLATCIALRGNTWDEKAMSWQRLTPAGWAALTIALVACGLGIYQIHGERAHRASLRLAAERSIQNITANTSVRVDILAHLSAQDANPTQAVLDARARAMHNAFDELAHDYDVSLELNKDVLDTSEIDAILQVSKGLRRSPSRGGRSLWDGYIQLLDNDRMRLAPIFCHGAPDAVSYCVQHAGMDLSIPMDEIFPEETGTH